MGDVHGCYDELLTLIDKIKLDKDDKLILSGDIVDRGPKRWECVQLAKQHNCILGNHEEKHLIYRNNPKIPMSEDHKKTADELTEEDYEYFESLPIYIKLPEYNAIVVHAGVLPDLPIENQPENILLHCQNICPPDRKHHWPSKSPPGYKFWTNYWKGPERIIFGHTVLEKPLVTEYAVGVDTGCVFGHALTAVVLPDWEIVSVPARKAYHSSHRVIAKYEIMDGIKCYS